MRTSISILGAIWILAGGSAVEAQDASLYVLQAQEARTAGNFDKAVALLEMANHQRPNDPLTLRLLGTNYAYLKRFPQAIETLKRAINLAPYDHDIKFALTRAYLWSGQYAKAEKTIKEINTEASRSVELAEIIGSLGRAKVAYRRSSARPLLVFTQSFSAVDVRGNHTTWRQTAGAVAFPASRLSKVTVEVGREDRGISVDTKVVLRVDRQLGARAATYFAFSITPDANFRERWAVKAGGEAAAGPTLSVLASAGYADYRSTSVTVFEPGVRWHSKDENLSLTVKSINLWGETGHQAGWSARGETQLSDSVRLLAGGATYPDTESGITRRVRSGFVATTVSLSDKVGLRVTFERERRTESYTRDNGTLGISWRF